MLMYCSFNFVGLLGIPARNATHSVAGEEPQSIPVADSLVDESLRDRSNPLVGLLGIEPSLHPPHGRVLPVYYSPKFGAGS